MGEEWGSGVKKNKGPRGYGRAIAQAVSRRFPNAVARIRARVWSCGISGGQSGIVAGFLLVLPVSPVNLRSTN
jgi:hypothetical protein